MSNPMFQGDHVVDQIRQLFPRAKRDEDGLEEFLQTEWAEASQLWFVPGFVCAPTSMGSQMGPAGKERTKSWLGHEQVRLESQRLRRSGHCLDYLREQKPGQSMAARIIALERRDVIWSEDPRIAEFLLFDSALDYVRQAMNRFFSSPYFLFAYLKWRSHWKGERHLANEIRFGELLGSDPEAEVIGRALRVLPMMKPHSLVADFVFKAIGDANLASLSKAQFLSILTEVLEQLGVDMESGRWSLNREIHDLEDLVVMLEGKFPELLN